MDAVNGIELTEVGALSHILRDLSEAYATLAFIASFDAPQAHKQILESSTAARAPDMMTTVPQQKRIMYTVLANMTMCKLTELFMQLKENDKNFKDGTVGMLRHTLSRSNLRMDVRHPQRLGRTLGRLLRRPSSRSSRRLGHRLTPLVLV